MAGGKPNNKFGAAFVSGDGEVSRHLRNLHREATEQKREHLPLVEVGPAYQRPPLRASGVRTPEAEAPNTSRKAYNPNEPRGNRNSGGEATNSYGWMGGKRVERNPKSGETRHCRFGTRCKYMHKYCPFVHVDGGEGQVSPVKVDNYWNQLRSHDERTSLRAQVDSQSAQKGL